MRKYSFTLVITVLMLLAVGSMAYAESANDFKLVNKTGYAIKDIYVAPSKSEDWGNEVLGEGVILEDGQAANIKFHAKASTTGTYDLKVVYNDDNSSVVWYGYDLTKIKSITIHYDRKADKTSAETEAAEESMNDFKLVNKTGYEIKDIYVAASKSEDWGNEVLGEGVILEDGQTVDIKFHPKASATGTYDLKVVYNDDNSSVVWYGYDLTKINKITIHYDRKADKTSAETE